MPGKSEPRPSTRSSTPSSRPATDAGAAPRVSRRSPMKRFLAFYHRLLTRLMVASVAMLVVPVSLQIISRYTSLIPSYIWTEEMSRFLFIWMVMLGAMIGIREGTHFEVDVWPELGRRANAALRVVSHLFVLVFALVFLYWGVKIGRAHV